MTGQNGTYGHYYQDEWVTIYHADCRDLLDRLRWDVAITDPPYGVGLVSKSTLARWGPNHERRTGYDDDPTTVRALLADVLPTLTAGRAMIFAGPARLWDYPPATAVGCVFTGSGTGRSPWGFQCCHPVLYYGADPYLADGRGSRPNSMIGGYAEKGYFGGGDRTTRHVDHPCAKPLSWMTWAVNRASRPDEMILDPFMGTGSTLAAAKKDRRRAIGIEIEERYCEIAVKRLAQGVLDLA